MPSDLKKMNNKTHRLEFDSEHLPKVRRAVYGLFAACTFGQSCQYIEPIMGENGMSRLVFQNN